MRFCGAFDEALARRGPGAVFLPDREGMLRFDANWTRTAWENAGGDGDGWTWVLVRDRGSGVVALALVTDARLLASHPRGDVRRFDSEEAAVAARDAFGRPSVCREAWC